MKPGIKTTEFWLAALATIVGFLLSSGVLETVQNPLILQVIAGVGAILTALGYVVPRQAVKQAQIKADAVAGIAAQETTRAVLAGAPQNPTK